MSLSDKIENWINAWGDKESAIPTKKVKESIQNIYKKIDKFTARGVIDVSVLLAVFLEEFGEELLE